MKIERLTLDKVVYDVCREKMGNPTMRTISVFNVKIVAVDIERGVVTASWNGNSPSEFRQSCWSKWRLAKPLLIRNISGSHRLATKEEIANGTAHR